MHLIEKYLNVQTVSKQVVPLNDKEKQWASKMQIGKRMHIYYSFSFATGLDTYT